MFHTFIGHEEVGEVDFGFISGESANFSAEVYLTGVNEVIKSLALNMSPVNSTGCFISSERKVIQRACANI